MPRAGPDRRRPGRLIVEWLVAGLVLSLGVVGLVMTGAAQRLDNLLYDFVVTTRPPPPPADIIIIGIDEASLAAIGPWPWPRRVHAAAIERIAAAGPLAIAYDILFTEPGGDDAMLSSAIAAAPAPVVLPMQFRVPGSNGRGYDPMPPHVGGHALIGHAGVRPDADGVVRTLDLALDGAARWHHVAALLASHAGGLPAFVPRPATAPLLRQGERLVGFRGAPGRFATLPFQALLAGEVPPELLRNRIVIVGATAAGLGDQFSTPATGSSGVMAGVELQASLTADLIEARNLRRAAPVWSIVVGLAALWLGMAALLRLQPAAAALCGLALMLALALAAAAGFRLAELWVGPAAALVMLAVAQPLWAWRRLAVVNRWMIDELAALGDDVVPTRRQMADPVTRTTALLDATIERVGALRELADAAVRGLPDATLLVDRHGAIVAANTAAEALFGAAPTLAMVDAVFAGRALPAFGAATLADPASPWRGEQEARGSIRDVRFTPWRDAAGAALGWIVRFADITALRRAERVREEALQLLTHDMRAPQATILALLDRHPGLDPALAERLRHLALRTIALADGYLRLARADAGDFAMLEIDLAAIAIEAIDEMWPQAQARRVRLDGDNLDHEALLTGDHQLLLRAIINLVGNAVKFSPEGGVVTVQLVDEGASWRVDVVDTGPGIAFADQARLFGRFRTGGTNPGGEGVGLGLAFVRAVADGHGGSVACVSEPGAGAMFSLRLPKSSSGG